MIFFCTGEISIEIAKRIDCRREMKGFAFVIKQV